MMECYNELQIPGYISPHVVLSIKRWWDVTTSCGSTAIYHHVVLSAMRWVGDDRLRALNSFNLEQIGLSDCHRHSAKANYSAHFLFKTGVMSAQQYNLNNPCLKL